VAGALDEAAGADAGVGATGATGAEAPDFIAFDDCSALGSAPFGL